MPRSPTMTILASPNLSRTTWTICVNAAGSPVLPGKTRTATGRPCGSVSSPYSICALPFLPSREWPRAASGQCRPSTQDDDRSNSAIRDGLTSAARCRPASFASTLSWRPTSQSIAAYTSSVPAPATSRSTPRVVSAHHDNVASFGAGATTRDTINAIARSRERPAGPSRPGSPNALACAHTAATCPCGNDRTVRNPSPAATNVLPERLARTASIVAGGSADRFARVSCRTLSPSRNERRTSHDTYSFSPRLLTTFDTCIAPDGLLPTPGTYRANPPMSLPLL